jgi:hypothetical protein
MQLRRACVLCADCERLCVRRPFCGGDSIPPEFALKENKDNKAPPKPEGGAAPGAAAADAKGKEKEKEDPNELLLADNGRDTIWSTYR